MRPLHWIKQGLKMVAIILSASTAYGLMMCLQNDHIRLEDTLMLGAGFFLMFGIFFSITFSTMLYTQDLPIVISFGCIRRDAFWGLQLSRLTYTVLIALFAGALYLLTPDASAANLFPAAAYVFAGFLIAHALGGIMSMLYVKFQKKGMITFGVFLMVFAITVTVGFVLTVSSGGLPQFSPYTPWLLLGGGALLLGLISLLEYRIIRSYNVKL